MSKVNEIAEMGDMTDYKVYVRCCAFSITYPTILALSDQNRDSRDTSFSDYILVPVSSNPRGNVKSGRRGCDICLI